MKIEQEQPGQKFNPVVITLESWEEVNKLYCLFNFTPVTDADDLFGQIHNELSLYEKGYVYFWHRIITNIHNHPALKNRRN
jgi:hypothetical protein